MLRPWLQSQACKTSGQDEIIVAPTPKNLPPEPAHEPSVPGLPGWVTAEWLQETVRVWQPYYKDPLTIRDAAEIITSWDRLLTLLREEPAK